MELKLKFQINGLIEKPRWYGIKCKCNHESVETEYPILPCLSCKFKHQENLLPRKSFEITLSVLDKNDKPTNKTKTLTCNKITINRGKKYQEILGWYNHFG